MHASLSQAERDRALAPFRDDVATHVAEVIRDGITSGAFDPDMDVELTVDLITGVMDAAVARTLAEPGAAPAITMSTAAFLRGALSPALPGDAARRDR